jgi:hypothetical protein
MNLCHAQNRRLIRETRDRRGHQEDSTANALEKGETDKDKENARTEKRAVDILNRKNEGVRTKR